MNANGDRIFFYWSILFLWKKKVARPPTLFFHPDDVAASTQRDSARYRD